MTFNTIRDSGLGTPGSGLSAPSSTSQTACAQSPRPRTQGEVSSSALAGAVAAADCSQAASTVLGFGSMGRQYVQALRALGLARIRVCSRSAGPLEALRGVSGVETVAGGFERLAVRAESEELGIIATPIASLMASVERLASLGFRRLLIEKPVSLWSSRIEQLAERLERQGIEAWVAYNRVAYPSFHEARARTSEEGGITSCAYTFTEMIRPDWAQRYPAEVLARLGVANSLHVMSLAHGLIGWPAAWSGHRAGRLVWHPAGSVFVGSGVSQRGVAFTYHADWGSTGRWSVEVHTPVSSYRLCPLEQLFRRASAAGAWEPVPVEVFNPDIKAGLIEQVAAALDPAVRALVPLVSVREAARLARFGEAVFGYEP